MDLPAAALALTASFWLGLPHGDTAQDLLETLAPFTFTYEINTGGVITGKPSLAGSEGMSWTGTTYTLGLLDVTDPALGGTPLLYPDLSMLDQVRVVELGAPVDAGSSGPSIGLVSKRSAAAWQAELLAGASPSALQSSGPSSPVPIARLQSLGRAEGHAGGGLGSSGVRVFAAGAITRSSHLERNVPTRLRGDVSSLFADVGARERTVDDWRVSGWTQQVTRPFGARARFADRDVHEHDRYVGLAGEWEHAGTVPLRVDAGVQSVRHTADAASEAQGTIERLRDGPVQELVANTPGTTSRTGVSTVAAPPPKGRHAFRFGGSVSYASIDLAPFGTGTIGETVGGLPARAWSYGYAGSDRRHEFTAAAHAADSISLGNALSLDVGGRIEGVTGSNAAAGIGWTSVEPRIALAYAPGDWLFIASARRYHPPLTLNLLAFGDPSGPSGSAFRWTDANGDGIVQQNELGPLIWLVGPGNGAGQLTSIDPALRRPHTDEAVVAIERRVGEHWSVRFSGYSRRKQDLIGAIDSGVPFNAWSVNYVFDPGLDLGGTQDDQMLPIYSRPPSTFGKDRYLLTNIPSVTGTYSGLDLSFATRGYEHLTVLGGATALKTSAPAAYRGFGAFENDDGIVGDAFSDPNSNTFAMGRLLFDRGYAAKVAASWRVGGGFTLGAVARYEDGQPFARLVLAPDLPQGPDVVRAYSNGRSRFTYTLTLDLRIAKTFTIGRGAATLAVDAFNALDTHNEVEENQVWGPSWRTATAVQPPRVIRISVLLRPPGLR